MLACAPGWCLPWVAPRRCTRAAHDTHTGIISMTSWGLDCVATADEWCTVLFGLVSNRGPFEGLAFW